MVSRGKGGGGERGGSRKLAVKLRTAKGRKIASTRWLQRQLNDPYVEEAKRRGYRSRAAFKLIEMDDKYRVLRPGMIVLDLGAAPGGWSQIAAERVGAAGGKGQVLAVDLAAIEPLLGVEVLTLDVSDEAAAAAIRAGLRGDRADVVLSDMASPATGHRATDHLRVVALVEAALDLAEIVLKPGGTFLAKVFQGGAGGELVARLKRSFAKVQHVKPKASRPESPEVYVLATGFRGAS
ncbi:MAG TPA: RlmE family RNA methyltransferase [Methyloceanibacter sp.]|jgi:23S rRNA (uridine2552-2'-O)-methyltransferase|nr:RlmE family RNA methyltransferase [Methyloceanibacter sp.]